MATLDIGIDLGTASILVYVKGRGVVLDAPSVVAFETGTHEVKAIGKDAQLMIGRTPGNITAIRPLKEGVISDYHVTEMMMRYFLERAVGRRTFRKPRVAVCVPSGVTEVERKAVEDATYQAGAKEVAIIEEPIAAAIGAKVDILEPKGSMIVDIGGGTTDVAVISLGGTVVSDSIKVAGDKFDEAIVRYMKSKNHLIIGEVTGEEIKTKIGTAYKRAEVASMDVRGLDMYTGLPITVNVTSDQIQEALRETTGRILDTICGVLENTPPELAGDIVTRGIILTGGGAMLNGLEELITDRTGINTILAPNPKHCVAIGTGKYIEFLSKFKAGMH